MLLSLHKPKAPISQRACDEETLVDVELGLDSKSGKQSLKSSLGAIFGSKSKRRDGSPTCPSHEPKSRPCAEPFKYARPSARARGAQALKRLRARVFKSHGTRAALQRSDSQMTLPNADSALANEPKATSCLTSVDVNHSTKSRPKLAAAKISMSRSFKSTKHALHRLAAHLGPSALQVLIPILKGVGVVVKFFLCLGWGIVKLGFWVAKAVLIGALAQVVFWGCCGSGLALLPLLPVYAIIRAISPWLAGHVKDPVQFILFGPWMLPMALLCWLLGEKFPGEPVNY